MLEEGQLHSQPRWLAQRLSDFLQLPKPLSTESVLSLSASNHTHAAVVGEALRHALRSFYDVHTPQVRQLFAQLAPPGSHWAAARWLTPRRAE